MGTTNKIKPRTIGKSQLLNSMSRIILRGASPDDLVVGGVVCVLEAVPVVVLVDEGGAQPQAGVLGEELEAGGGGDGAVVAVGRGCEGGRPWDKG